MLRLLGFLTPFWWRVVLASLLGVLTVASGVGLLGMASYLIATAALKPLLISLLLPSYLVRLLSVTRAVARYTERLVSHDLTFRLLARVRARFYAAFTPLAPSRLLAYRSGDVLARHLKDVEDLQNLYQGIIGPFVVALAITGLTVGLLHAFSATLAWAALGFLCVAGVGVPLLTAALARGHGSRYVLTRAELSAQLVDTIQGVQDLLANGAAARRVRAIMGFDGALARVQRRMAFVAGLGQAVLDLLMNLAGWTILVLAIPLVAARAIDGVYLAVLPLVIMAAFEGVQPLGPAFQALGRSTAAGRRLVEVLDARPPLPEPAVPQPPPAACSLAFDGVRFLYPGADSPAVDGVTFALRPGQRMAVVGPSGSGKTTLARLALRFWDPVDGTVHLGGRDIRHYALEDVRAAISLVAQDTYLFSDTVRGNLLLARPDASDEEIRRALEAADLAAFVDSLPDGLATWVGEQGLRLSGGERQRLAIARALLKDAPLLLLDEPTANLDPITERAVLHALDTLMRGRTTLLITHRLVAMDGMDQILVLDHCRIVERGRHGSLRTAGGLYQRLLDVQNSVLIA
jgi:ATP-binding cassette subfamily C protein CydC